jgi:tRNA (guanine9-N1)-methyltransferase
MDSSFTSPLSTSGDNDSNHSENNLPEISTTIKQSATSASKSHDHAKLPPPSCSATSPLLSKNQIKKMIKRERLKQIQHEKKEQKKEQRRARAVAAGRDLEAEQAWQEERNLLGHRTRAKQDQWTEKRKQAVRKFQLCIDCAFEHQLREREIASLAQQIRYCYAYNKKSPHPSLVAVTSLGKDSVTRSLLEKETGYSMWHQRAFVCTEQSLEEYYGCNHTAEANGKVDAPSSPKKLVYLTSDSTTALEHLEDDTIYIIGGIVDRNRLKGLTLNRANELGLANAKLPLDEHLSQMPSTRVLTCNHVFDILLKYREFGNDWSMALQKVLPGRKGAELKDKKGTGKDARP